MMLRTVIVTLICASASLCQPASPPVFDVASVKVSGPAVRGGNPHFGDDIQATPGSLVMRRVTLKACIQWAYNVFEYQVTGLDAMEAEHYDIAAKAAGPAQTPELRVMLQALLADRFQLKLHRQTKEMQAYVLTVGKNGPKFHEAKTEGDSELQPDPKTMTVQVHRVPMSNIIDPLSRIFQMPVVDKTGLTGRYDVAINMTKYIPQAGEKPDPAALIQTALQEELGLKLEARKMPLDLLIVDHAAKAPTDN